MITKQQFSEWMENPVTETFLSIIEDKREDCLLLLANREFQLNQDFDLKRYFSMIGRLNAFTSVLNAHANIPVKEENHDDDTESN